MTISLAAICQATYLVQQLSYSGTCDQNAFKTSLTSILEITPDSIIKIYGNHEKNLIIGLKTLISILTFSDFAYSYLEFITYILKMFIIEKKIKNNRTTVLSLKKSILSISNQYYINRNIKKLTNQIAKLYFKTISSLGSNILIKGLKIFLKNLNIQEKIRCLLFSGIRAIVLWKQYYGNQVKLIRFRKHIIREAKKILYKCKNII